VRRRRYEVTERSNTGPALGAYAVVGGRPWPSADLLRQLDDDPLRAADVAEPIDVFIVLHFVDELTAAGSHAGDGSVDVVDCECDMADAQGVRWRVPVAPRTDGEWNFTSSSRPWPSGVSTIAYSTRTPSSPTTRSTQPPSTCPSPCSLSPSSTKNAVAAARSSTTMPTCSMRWIVTRSTVARRALVCRDQR
jgi:hypothetical protein